MSATGLDVTFNADEIDTYLYAPAHMSYGGSCLEMVFAHYVPAASLERHEFWVWDHCSNQTDKRMVIENMEDPFWQDSYVREMADPPGDMVYVETLYYQGCWTVEMYNFEDGVYDEKFTSCDSRSNNYGWTMWEYDPPTEAVQQACYSKPSIQAPQVNLIIQLGQQVQRLEDAEFSGDATELLNGPCFDDGGPFTMALHQYGGWHAYTPF